MTKHALALALAALAAFAPVSAAPVDKEPDAAAASDPRMAEAIRHANAKADRTCGAAPGAVVDLATKTAARTCRRRMVNAAITDAEIEIAGR